MDYLMANNFPLLDHFIFSAGIEVNIPDLPENESDDLPALEEKPMSPDQEEVAERCV